MAARNMIEIEKGKIQSFHLNITDVDIVTNSAYMLNMKSKKLGNIQELIQSDPTSCPQNKKEITKYIS